MDDPDPNEAETGKTIWSNVTLDELVDAIASLDDHVAQLKDETWRLNVKKSSSNSLWHQVINKCKRLEHNEQTRASLYKIWLKNRRKINDLVEEKQRSRNGNQNHSDNNDIPVTETNNRSLLPDPSLPLPERPNTRANQAKTAHDNDNQSSVINETFISFTPIEWKSVFSRTHQIMKPGWRKVFYNKLTSNGIKCSLGIEKAHIKKGKRKRNCKFFGFNAVCTIDMCPRMFQVILKNEPDEISSAFFLVKIFNEENHDKNIETSALQLRGEERARVGEKFKYIFSKAVLISDVYFRTASK
jgi:hypothetical protein